MQWFFFLIFCNVLNLIRVLATHQSKERDEEKKSITLNMIPVMKSGNLVQMILIELNDYLIPPPSMVQYHSECWSSLFCALFSVNSIEWNIEMTSSFHSDDLEYFQVLQIWTKQFVWIFIWTIFVTSKERNSVDKRKELEIIFNL